MNRLLKLEFRKQFRQKKLYVCFAVMVGMLVITAFMDNAFANLLSAMDQAAGEAAVVGADFFFNAIDNSSLVLIVGIFAVLTVCEDFEQNTIKNVYSRGYSRSSVYLAKVYTVAICTVAMFIGVLVVSAVICAIFFNFDGFNEKGLYEVLFVKLLCVLAVNMLNVFIAFFFRKNGIAIAASIFLPMVVELGLALGTMVMKLEKINLTDYWVSSAGMELSSYPLSAKELLLPAVVSIVYIIGLGLLGKLVSERAEV